MQQQEMRGDSAGRSFLAGGSEPVGAYSAAEQEGVLGHERFGARVRSSAASPNRFGRPPPGRWPVRLSTQCTTLAVARRLWTMQPPAPPSGHLDWIPPDSGASEKHDASTALSREEHAVVKRSDRRQNWFRLAGRAFAVALVVLCAAADMVAAQAPRAPGAAEGERGGRRSVIRFLTTNDFPPFNYLDEDNVLTGFHVDLARAICLELNTQCDVVARPWEELMTALGRRQGDAIIAGHMVSARAMAQVDFTERYFFTPGRFVGRRAGPQLDVTPSGLSSKRIAVAKGTTHEAYLQAFFPDSAIVSFETQELARDALMGGKTDLLFDDGISLVLWINGEASKACCDLKGGPYLEPKYFGDGIAIAVSKSDPQLRADLNSALRKLRASGRFEELVLRYFPYRVF